MIQIYLKQLFAELAFGHHVIYVSKEKIVEIERITQIYISSFFHRSRQIELEASNSFPNLKSLGIIKNKHKFFINNN